MKVLKFQKNKIYLQDNEVIDINRDIKAKYRIKTDSEITFEEYKSIIYESALSKSYFLLSMRDYTKRDLLNKFRMKYKRSSTVEEELKKVIYKLEELGYIDDYSYAKSYIDRKKSVGRKKIEYELHIKGISSEIISNIYNNENIARDEKELIEKEFHKVRNKEKDKQVAYFMRKGFKLSDIL
ncbi:MAG: regulatory protein RecX, partial [Psychrilyobacter sp.]|nr:regulatory protein RecX [Psychrilyobacter sp.]